MNSREKVYLIKVNYYNSAKETYTGLFVVFAWDTEMAIRLVKNSDKFKSTVLGGGDLTIDQLTTDDFLNEMGLLHSSEDRAFEIYYDTDN